MIRDFIRWWIPTISLPPIDILACYLNYLPIDITDYWKLNIRNIFDWSKRRSILVVRLCIPRYRKRLPGSTPQDIPEEFKVEDSSLRRLLLESRNEGNFAVILTRKLPRTIWRVRDQISTQLVWRGGGGIRRSWAQENISLYACRERSP
jgi:hypothetical protein